MGKRGKGKRVRSRGYLHKEKVIARRRMRSNKYKASSWKIKKFPDIFKVVDHFPYIVRRDDTRYK